MVRKSVVLSEDTMEAIQEIAKLAKIKTPGAINLILMQGIKDIRNNGLHLTLGDSEMKPLENNGGAGIDKKALIDAGNVAAKSGSYVFSLWLTELSDPERSMLQYLIRPWKKIAKDADIDRVKRSNGWLPPEERVGASALPISVSIKVKDEEEEEEDDGLDYVVERVDI